MTLLRDADKGPLQPQGCYYATSADGLNTPDMSVQLSTIPNLVPDLCIQACLNQQYTYAAVQVGYSIIEHSHLNT